LANILRAADEGDPVDYLDLAEAIEERDPHYIGVLGTRRRSVAQLEITVEAASDAPEDAAKADLIRAWLKRDELQDELFDMLDAIGKGYSFTEIIWDTSAGDWWPERLERRDPRWFRFDRRDLSTPRRLEAAGSEVPLDPFKFIFARMSAKSGLPMRSGIARIAAWGWMFKAYTQRDWAIFTQTFGQPLRLGKYGPNASKEDRATLFRAVSNIAGDCAAIIPESMQIEFVETANVGASSDLYLKRADWLDQQISKAVLGQTATTDAVTGGLGSGKEHRQVQEDIERADARALAAIINRDLIRPWMDLEYGPPANPRTGYPRLVIARPDTEDLKQLTDAVVQLVPLGMRVSMQEMRAKYGLSDPAPDEETLHARPQTAPEPPPSNGTRSLKGVGAFFKGGKAEVRGTEALQSEGASTGLLSPPAPTEVITDRLTTEAAPGMEAMLSKIEAMLAAASSFDEFAEMLKVGLPEIDAGTLAAILADAMMAADLGGRAEVDAENG
jgi:phage gp29-like protein